MKKITFALFFIAVLFQSCQRQVIIPLESCQTYWQDSTATHPKATALQNLIDKYVEKGMPGITLAVHTPEGGIWVGAAGKAKIETDENVETCHVFHSASVAKTYHVTAAMTLVEAGKLELDKTIDHYLPDLVCANLANRNTATIRQLMNHTSGIPDFIEQMSHITDYFNNLLNTFTTDDYLNYVCGKKPEFKAGAKVSYSNTNTVLLALIMDEIAGNHADVLTKNIFEKLNLTQTFYKNEKGYPAPTGLVNTYVDTRGNGALMNASHIERNFAGMNIGHDAMMATAFDYMKFMHALFNEQIISRPSLDEMIDFVNYENTGKIKIGEGLGLEIMFSDKYKITRAGHNGGSLGAANNVFHYIEKNITIAVCSNFGGFLPTPLSRQFYHWNVGKKDVLLGDIERIILE